MGRGARARVVLAALAVIALCGHAALSAPEQARAAAPGCAPRVAVLGADMSAGGRFEVQRALAVGPHTTQLVETVAEERRQAGGLIPATLLFKVAVSSAVLRPLPAGAGLDVTVNPAITLDTAQSYANALLTAGVLNAAVRVAAPTSQPALGTTAMLGLLRAAHLACLPLDPARERLALREIVLTGELAGSMGRDIAPRLLFRLKAAAASRRVLGTAALSALIARDSADSAALRSVPVRLRGDLVAFLHDLVAGGAYVGVAAAHPSMGGATLLHATVRLAANTTGPASVSVVGAARVALWRGALIAATGDTVTLRLGAVRRAVRLTAGARVYRNGAPVALAALRDGDSVTLTLDATGRATRVTALGAPPSGDRGGGGMMTLLALLVLLALLAAPLLVASRRQRPRAVPVAAMAVPLWRGQSSRGHVPTRSWRGQTSQALRSTLAAARFRGRAPVRRGKGKP